MVGLVLVSHSRPLALAVKGLVEAMTGPGFAVAVAAGAGDDHSELGTNAVEIEEAVRAVMSGEGVLLLVDMGSAVLSAEVALTMLEEELQPKVRICPAPFVEGAVAAGVTAHLGGSLTAVAAEAEKALEQKRSHLTPAETEVSAPQPKRIATPASASSSVTVPLDIPHGLHARPAARLAREAGKFKAEVQIENATTHKGPVSAASLSALASLELLQGHLVRIRATGPEAEAALRALRDLVQNGLGEKTTFTAAPSPETPISPQSPAVLPVVPGIAWGPVVHVEHGWPEVPDGPGEGIKAERERFRQAVAKAHAALLDEARNGPESLGAEQAEIFEAQAAILDDPALVARTEEFLGQKLSAAAAWKRSAMEITQLYRGFKDEYIRQRANDVQEVGLKVLGLLGYGGNEELSTEAEGILVVDDLTAAEAIRLPETRISGVVCLDGALMSHGAILLRALGIPTVARARKLLAAKLDHEPFPALLAIDGAAGRLWIDPDATERNRLETLRSEQECRRTAETAEARQPAVLRDGGRIEVAVNVGNAADARAGLARGAEGIGLLRTEFLFLDRSSAPSEEEQYERLREIFAIMEGRPIVLRTLDAGGDKELPYLGQPREENPFLGVRALRICLRHPELFQSHLRAVLRAGTGRDLRVMFPMVAELEEFRLARRALEQAHTSLIKETVPHLWPVPMGTMIEIPSAALLAESLAAEADFFSIGTNDLTQYTLAADRGNPELAALQDALHPAVLGLIDRTVRAAAAQGKKVSICGEAAGDPAAALILIGLGIEGLSMGAASIPRLKSALRSAYRSDLERLASEALRLGNAREVRELLARHLRAVTD